MSETTFGGWLAAPRIGVVMPDPGRTGWDDAAFWSVLLEVWGFPFEPIGHMDAVPAGMTTLIVPAPLVDGRIAACAEGGATTVLAVGGDHHRSTFPDRDVPLFGPSVEDLTHDSTEQLVDAAYAALERAAPAGLVGLWRWPSGKRAALVVDGDVDHPSGVDPECSRYVTPALETAERAGFDAYGIFVAGANVEAEPGSFPASAAAYYNHSYSHPYSHWDPRTWESLDDAEIQEEILHCRQVFASKLKRSDEAMFRLPHFQLDASERTYAVLDRLGYRADSSIGANVAITGGLPFHPAMRAWSERPEDRAFARGHPDPSDRHRLLQLPISSDPTDRAFMHGCCSYNTLGEGIRNRTADPAAYEQILDRVLDDALERRTLAHLFIDPPDAGYGRLPGDRVDYASAVERWMRRAVERRDLSILTTAELTSWWLEREDAVGRLRWRAEKGQLSVTLSEPPIGATLSLLAPAARGGGWSQVELASEAA